MSFPTPTTAYAASPGDYSEGRVRSAAARERAADRAHIARVLASHPHYSEWLEDRERAAAAAALTIAAEDLAALGHHPVATWLGERAADYRPGAVRGR